MCPAAALQWEWVGGIGSLMGSMGVSVTAFVLGQQQERGNKAAARAGHCLCLKTNIACLPGEFAVAHKMANSANSLVP